MPPRNTLSGKHVLFAALGLSLFIAIGVMTIALVTRRPPAPPPMPRNDAPIEAPPHHSERAPEAPSATPTPAAQPAPPTQPDALARVDLSTPRAAIEAQADLLRTGNDEAFRATFVAALRAQITPETIVACRAYLTSQGGHAYPEWDSLAEDTEDGHPVVRLRMTRGALVYTTYHQTDGRWLSDQVWCLPRAQNALPSHAL